MTARKALEMARGTAACAGRVRSEPYGVCEFWMVKELADLPATSDLHWKIASALLDGQDVEAVTKAGG